MNRRLFLASSVGSAVAVGCSRPVPNPAAARISTAETKQIADQLAAREAHLKLLDGFRVPASEKRTTPKRSVELAKLFPDLDLRTRLKVTHRLHPRFGDEPAADDSKMGGRFWWPASELWPLCEKSRVPLVPVLQLKIDDVPGTVKFKPNTDLLQVLWSPRDSAQPPLIMWRKWADVSKPLADYPSTEFALMDLVPVACRLFPEPVTEMPDWATGRVTPLADRIKAWKPEAGGDPVEFYRKHLSAAPGTKIGGFPYWLGEAKPPACATCNRGMDYLLTIDSDEWRGGAGWIPTEEPATPAKPGFANPHGLSLPSGNRHAFVCRRCADWPTAWAG